MLIYSSRRARGIMHTSMSVKHSQIHTVTAEIRHHLVGILDTQYIMTRPLYGTRPPCGMAGNVWSLFSVK